MSGKEHCKKLSLWLRKELESGLPVDDDVLAFMQATFGTNQLEELWPCVGDSETDSLLELIFYPDSALQTRFENQWGDTVFSYTDQQAVIALLTAPPPAAILRLPGDSAPLQCTVPDFAVEAFVQRLNITWQPAPTIKQALTNHLEQEQSTAARVLLRHATIAWHERQVELTAHFIRHMPAEAHDYAQCLGFLLAILSELGIHEDPYTFLVSKKRFCFQSLCKAEDFEQRRRKTNMEILMMQGERAAHGDIEQWRFWMRTIDRICLALFECTEFFHQPTEHGIDLQQSAENQSAQLQSVIRMLS
jgi:hypothetical protein